MHSKFWWSQVDVCFFFRKNRHCFQFLISRDQDLHATSTCFRASCAPDPGAHDVPPGHFSRAAAVKYFFTINGSPPDYLREMLVLANEMFNSPPVFEWVLLLSFHMAARSAEANMPHDARVRHTAARSAEDNVPPDARGGGGKSSSSRD